MKTNKEFVQELVDLLIESYGDALIFEVFLDTWEPLESVRDAVEERLKAKAYKRVRNRVRYNHRELILSVDDYTCLYCAEKFAPEDLEVDHLVPIEAGGDESFENSVTSCGACNNRKGNRYIPDIDLKDIEETRRKFIESGVFNGATYEDFKEEYQRQGKIRGRDRFRRTDGGGTDPS